MPPTIFTIGHSNRPIAEFLAMLRAHGVGRVVDIRTIPRSRHNPQFGTEALAASLAAAGIGYRHEPALGGLRRPRKDSANTAWRNDAFRGYADHMRSAEFAAAIEALIREADDTRLALMCAESVPWRCHRSLVGDALVVRGVPVIDILSAANARPHALTAFAVVAGTVVTYPGEGELFGQD